MILLEPTLILNRSLSISRDQIDVVGVTLHVLVESHKFGLELRVVTFPTSHVHHPYPVAIGI